MTEPSLASSSRRLRVAIVGSGPSAFYAAEALFKAENLEVRVDIFDRLPTPFGLVRGGVAPDHQKIKSVTKVYEKIAQHPGFRFFGNVELGRDLQVEDLRAHYDQIIYAVGNEGSRDLGIPGEDLGGVHSATEFVFWYNGHPDYRDRQFDLHRARRVAVIGNGNVAMDVGRILIQDPERLAPTDIADYALEALRRSRIEEVLLIGRRGPAQAAFAPKEIQEIAALDGVDLVVDPEAVDLDDVTLAWLKEKAQKPAHRNVKFLTEQSEKGEGSNRKKLRSHFLLSPIDIQGQDGKVSRIRLQQNELHPDQHGTPRPRGIDVYSEEEVQLVFSAVGYRGKPIHGVPYDESWGIIPNKDGRVLQEEGGNRVPDQYVVGWAKRGPSGLIGTNSPDSKATVQAMLEDLEGRTAAPLLEGEEPDILSLLAEKGVPYVSYEDWQWLDRLEQERGQTQGRVRQKYCSVDEMLEALRQARS